MPPDSTLPATRVSSERVIQLVHYVPSAFYLRKVVLALLAPVERGFVESMSFTMLELQTELLYTEHVFSRLRK
jgi:hypothetical protein